MKILCKVKDYYDYLVSIYGIDEDIIYDRREYNMINKDSYACSIFFDNTRIKEDDIRKLKNIWLLDDDNKFKYTKSLCGKFYYFLLEIGYCHIYFEVERYVDSNDNVIINPTLLSIEHECEKISSYPISIIPLQGYGIFKHKNYKDLICVKDKELPNPILNTSYLSGMIDCDMVYNELYNYLISIREKKINDNRSDIQKLESHGFDKKTSFRGQ